MATKIFLTGATGYIGGTVLNTLITTHPEYEITALIRTAEQASKLKSAYPSVTPFIGNLDETESLTRAASSSSIIINTANVDHATSARAFLSASPKFLIHTSGAAILPDLTSPTAFGTAPKRPDEEYSDISDIGQITSFPSHHLHRKVDDIVITGASSRTRTAIICPPAIYGTGTGAFNTASVQIPSLAEFTLKRKRGFFVGDGGSEWSFVHVIDLADVYLKLVEAAVRDGDGAEWFDGGAQKGYYFAENGTYAWKAVAEKIVEISGKWLENKELESLSKEKVNEEIMPYGGLLWGTNAVTKADRARKVLGWEPKEKGVLEILEDEVKEKAEKLELAGTSKI